METIWKGSSSVNSLILFIGYSKDILPYDFKINYNYIKMTKCITKYIEENSLTESEVFRLYTSLVDKDPIGPDFLLKMDGQQVIIPSYVLRKSETYLEAIKYHDGSPIMEHTHEGFTGLEDGILEELPLFLDSVDQESVDPLRINNQEKFAIYYDIYKFLMMGNIKPGISNKFSKNVNAVIMSHMSDEEIIKEFVRGLHKVIVVIENEVNLEQNLYKDQIKRLEQIFFKYATELQNPVEKEKILKRSLKVLPKSKFLKKKYMESILFKEAKILFDESYELNRIKYKTPKQLLREIVKLYDPYKITLGLYDRHGYFKLHTTGKHKELDLYFSEYDDHEDFYTEIEHLPIAQF